MTSPNAFTKKPVLIILLITLLVLLLISIIITLLILFGVPVFASVDSYHDSSIAPPAQTDTPFLPLPTLTISSTPTHLITQTPQPTPTPTLTTTHTALPSTDTPNPTSGSGIVQIYGVIGHAQQYTLDCEARSAVDWAAYFGFDIPEDDFLAFLPKSDDPDEGFVGEFNDAQGQIPPNSYGVHAAPIARLLRSYGVPAQEYKNFTWEELQAELQAGNPVIAWVIFLVEDGTPIAYTASNGNTTTVAHYEHTVIITGYDESRVSLVDGSYVYHRTIDQFLRSWSVLGNMVVVYR